MRSPTGEARVDGDVATHPPMTREWESLDRRGQNALADIATWRDQIVPILQDFTERTPGSLLDVRESCITWHFRDTDEKFGLTQCNALQLHMDQLLHDLQIRVISEHTLKYMLIQPSRINKGRALMQVVDEHLKSDSVPGFDFMLVMGDERTDEDIFSMLNDQHMTPLQGSHVFTVTVGRKPSRAQYFVDDPDAVHATLQALAAVSNPSDEAEVYHRRLSASADLGS